MASVSSAPARRRAAKKAGGSAAKKETRERLLDVALDLFSEKGYAETSLREIAAELGVSKAALYYHFESEGHERDVGRWHSAANMFVDDVLSNRKLFEVHARNHGALEELHQNAEHARAHDD